MTDDDRAIESILRVRRDLREAALQAVREARAAGRDVDECINVYHEALHEQDGEC